MIIHGRRSFTIAWLAGLLIVVPILVDLALRGTRAAVTYLAHDSFYYLAVGKNFANLGRFTFDGTRPTNGFHPLWQVCVAMVELARAKGGWSDLANLSLVVVICALIVAAAMVVLGRTLIAAYGRLSPLFLLSIMGLVGAAVSLCHPRFGTLYTFVNGMETPLALLGYALTLAAGLRLNSSPRSGALLGAALAFLTLSRLDHAILVGVLLGLLIVRAVILERNTLRPLLYAMAVVAGVLTTEAIVAKSLWGGIVPLSGIAKSTFPHPKIENILRLWTVPSEDTWGRLAQLYLPMPLAAADLWIRLKRCRAERQISAWHTVLAAWSVFTLILCAYNVAFVTLFHQGTWYFATVLLHTTVITYDHARLRIDRLDAGRFRAAIAWASPVLPILFFVLVFHYEDPNTSLYAFIENERAPLLDHYAGQTPHLYSVDDGLLSYLTPFPTMSGVGLMLDQEAYAHQRSGGSLLALAYQRGFDRFASWFYGASLRGLDPTSDEREIALRLTQIPWFWDEFKLHGQGFVFHVEYVSPSGKMYVLAFKPRSDASAIPAPSPSSTPSALF